MTPQQRAWLNLPDLPMVDYDLRDITRDQAQPKSARRKISLTEKVGCAVILTAIAILLWM